MNFILTILIGAILYCVYAISLPAKDLTKLNIDFKRAYYNSKAETYIVKNRIIFDLSEHANIQHQKAYQAKTYIRSNGYRYFKGSNILFHRWMMEKSLGRKLRSEEVVHHIDGVKLNNKISNLRLFPNQEAHDQYHRQHLRNYGTWHEEVPEYVVYKRFPQYAKQF